MMAFDVWLSLTLASISLLILPGPTVLLVVAVGLTHGPRAALLTVPAVTAGGAIALILTLVGFGSLLHAWPEAILALRLGGAAYMAYLATQLWEVPPMALELPSRVPRAFFWQILVVTALNPKGLIFFVAFIPGFIDPAVPLFGQAMIIVATYLTIVALIFLGFALGAGILAKQDRLGSVQGWLSRSAAVVLAGVAAVMVFEALG